MASFGNCPASSSVAAKTMDLVRNPGMSDDAHDGEAASGLLAPGLGIVGLILGGIGHGEAGAVHHLYGAAAPPLLEALGGLARLDQLLVQFLDTFLRQARASPTVGAGLG